METIDQIAWMKMAIASSPCQNDSDMSRRLGVSTAVFSRWKHGQQPLPEERLVEICELADLDPDVALLLRQIWTAKPSVRPIYEGIFQRFARVAIVAFAFLMLLVPVQNQALASPSQAINAHETPFTAYYEKFRVVIP